MSQSYRKLRSRMMEHDMDLQHLARTIVRSRATASARLNGHEPWGLDEIYAVCKELDIPFEEIHIYFPPVIAKENGRKRNVG